MELKGKVVLVTGASRGIGAARATSLKRNGLPEDIAGAVLFLASDASRFVTGQYIPVSGGIMML